MTKILVVTGSVRKGNVNSKIVDLVKSEIEAREGAEVQVADLGELKLPFYDAATPPSAEGFEIENERAKAWSEQVEAAEAVIMVVPEYNHSLSAIQKNAIDWLYREWTDKPMAFVAYGWYAGANSLAQLKEIGTVVKWNAIDQSVGLQFTKDIDTEGALLAEDDVRSRVSDLLDSLVAAV